MARAIPKTSVRMKAHWEIHDAQIGEAASTPDGDDLPG
jgi:hypothetical protein